MRTERVEALLKQEIAKIIQTRLDSSKIGFISITGVRVTPDLSKADVFYSQIGSDEEKEVTFATLKRAAGFIKGELGRIIRLKYIPKLTFRFDEGIERGALIAAQLRKLKDES
ncbi:MAG: 30S ribosome-binding factor RbfA [bacterium]|nr:30S ribosome-binding factor RbfA [bacterium]